MIYFIADTHFNDVNILDFGPRKFDSIYHMNNTIIKNWNDTLSDDDTIFVLGDIGKEIDKHPECVLETILSNLKGKKILIKGNHDKYISNIDKIGFDKVYDYPICIEDFYWLSHEPMFLNQHMPYVNIHGHIHSNLIMTNPSKNNKYVNVSVEMIDYIPMSFDKIKARFKGDI